MFPARACFVWYTLSGSSSQSNFFIRRIRMDRNPGCSGFFRRVVEDAFSISNFVHF